MLLTMSMYTFSSRRSRKPAFCTLPTRVPVQIGAEAARQRRHIVEQDAKWANSAAYVLEHQQLAAR